MSELPCIHSILVQISDMDRSLAFWRDGLGLPFVLQEEGSTCWECVLGGVKILLHPAWADAVGGQGAIIEIAVADVDAIHARLVAQGHAPEAPPQDRPWGRTLGLIDPDGYMIGVTTR